MSTTKKHQSFVSEPIGNKPVGALPGIGKVRATRLEDQGYDKAQAVLGQFLVQNRNEDRFRGWLKDTSGANAKQSRDCSASLKEWSDNFM